MKKSQSRLVAGDNRGNFTCAIAPQMANAFWEDYDVPCRTATADRLAHQVALAAQHNSK